MPSTSQPRDNEAIVTARLQTAVKQLTGPISDINDAAELGDDVLDRGEMQRVLDAVEAIQAARNELKRVADAAVRRMVARTEQRQRDRYEADRRFRAKMAIPLLRERGYTVIEPGAK